MIRIGLIPILAAIALSGMAPGAEWPHWRGPTRDGKTTEESGWRDGTWLSEKPRWTMAVGEGASSPVVVGDHVYWFGWAGGQDTVQCVQVSDGKEVWAVRYKTPQYGRHHMGDEGLYSGPSSTPEYDPATGFLYTLACDGALNCWDTRQAGKKVWGRNLYDECKAGRRPKLTRAPQRDYGYTSSPLVYRDWLLVEVGAKAGNLFAFDKKTGGEVWRSESKDEAGHTGGPALMTVEGIPCVVVATQRNVTAMRLDAGHEGKTLGEFPWVTDFANTISGPAVHGDCVLIAAAYNHGAMVKLRFTKAGAKEVWRKPHPSKVCTPVIHDGSIYVVWQTVRCIDWETGALRWEGGRFGDPGSCIVTADERVIAYGAKGRLALVESATRSPKGYTEVAVREGLFRTEAWPHVALSNGRILVRDRQGNAQCFGRSP